VVFSSPDKPDLSTSQKEAQALGFDLGTPEGAQGYAQWRQSLTRPPAGTTVNVPAQYPNAPQGFHYEGGPDDIRLVVTPGGPADLEQRAQAEKEQAAQAADVRQLGTVSRLTDRVLSTVSDPSWSPTLALGTRYVPSSAAAQVQRDLDALGGMISIERLSQMRAESPTGGALGNVTEGELEILRSLYGNLSIAQDPDILAENLEDFRGELDRIVNGPQGGGAPQQSPPAASGAPGGSVNLGTGKFTPPPPQAPVGSDFSNMSLEQLNALDRSRMTDDQLRAAAERYKSLGGM
jgi:hypothetical protein